MEREKKYLKLKSIFLILIFAYLIMNSLNTTTKINELNNKINLLDSQYIGTSMQIEQMVSGIKTTDQAHAEVEKSLWLATLNQEAAQKIKDFYKTTQLNQILNYQFSQILPNFFDNGSAAANVLVSKYDEGYIANYRDGNIKCMPSIINDPSETINCLDLIETGKTSVQVEVK